MAETADNPKQSIVLRFTGEGSEKGKAASAPDKQPIPPPPPTPPPPVPQLAPTQQQATQAPPAPAAAPPTPAPAPAPTPAPAPSTAPATQAPATPAQQLTPLGLPPPKNAAEASVDQEFQQALQQNQQEQAQANTDGSVKMAPADPANNWPIEPMRIRQMRIDLQNQQKGEKLDAMNPPVEFPLLKAAFGIGGYLGGGVLGSGGNPENLPGIFAGENLGGMAGVHAYNALQNLWDALTGTTNDQGQPITLNQEFFDALKTGAMTAGGSGGATVGETLSQTGGARILGGAIGTAAGTYTADQIAAIGKIWDLVPKDERTPTTAESIKDAVVNGGLDMLVNTALSKPTKSAFMKMTNWALGIGPKEIEARLTAAKYGITLTANNLSDTAIANLYRNIVTRVMPSLSGPFKKRFIQQLQEGRQALGDFPSKVARGPVPTATQLGNDTIQAANRSLDSVLDAIDQRYNKTLVEARDAGASFNTEFRGKNQDGVQVPSLKEWARSVLAAIKKGAPYGKKGVVPKTAMTNLANDILSMRQYAFPEELNALGKRMDDIYSKATQSDRDLIDEGRDSLFGSFEDSKSLKSKMRDFGWEFQQVMREAAEARRVFDTPAGKKLAGAGIRTGRAPTRVTMSPDVAGDALFNMDDPAQVRELRKRIGDNLMNQGAAYFLQKKIAEATTNGLFNPETFAKNIGLEAPGSPAYQAMKEALATSPIKMEDVSDLVNSMRQMMKNPPADTATIIARAAILSGGPKGILKYLFPIGILEGGKGVFGMLSKNPGTSMAMTAALLLIAKKFSKVMTDPAYVRDATEFFNTNSAIADRKMAYLRLIRAIYHDELDALSYRTERGAGPSARMRAQATGTDEGSPFLRSAPITTTPQLFGN